MSNKTSQLQIRISPEQKIALKRLAADAGQSVSSYVLATVLPATHVEFGHRVRAVRSNADRGEALADLHEYLAGLTPHDFASTVREVDLAGFPGILANQVAALVEDEARVRGVASPEWADQVQGPARPHFAWDLRSLRPYLMRLTPAAFKRRGVYIDPPIMLRRTQQHSAALAPLLDLNALLESEGVLGEICVAGGAVFLVAFRAKPESRRARHLFHATAVAWKAVHAVGREHGLDPDWLDHVARAAVDRTNAGSSFHEDRSLRVYRAPADYVLAMRAASLPFESSTEDETRARQELEELLRINDVSREQDLRALLEPYFTERQLPDDLTDFLTFPVAP